MRRLLSKRWRRQDEGVLVRGEVVEEIRDVYEMEATGNTSGYVRWRSVSDADPESPAVPQSPHDFEPFLHSQGPGTASALLRKGSSSDNASQTSSPTSKATAEDTWRFLRPSACFRCVLLLEHLAFWAGMLVVVPFLAKEELTCSGDVVWSVHILFGSLCSVLTMTELVLMSLSARGQMMLCKKVTAWLRIFQGVVCRFGLYSDVLIALLAMDCGPHYWRTPLGAVFLGVVALQVLPGIYYMLRFTCGAARSFEACMASDLHALVETLDPTGIAFEAYLQPTGWPPGRRASGSAQPARSTPPPVPSGPPQSAAYEGLTVEPGEVRDGEDLELERWQQRRAARIEGMAELTAALGACDPGRLAAAVESASSSGCQGRQLRAARSQLDVEAKLQQAVGALRWTRTLTRLLSEDLWLALAQGYFLYRTWGTLTLVNRGLAIASVATSVLAPLGCGLLSSASTSAARGYLCTRVASELQVAMNAKDMRQIQTCCRSIVRVIPEGSLLRQRIELAQLELPTSGGADQDRFKTADVLGRFSGILRGEGRALSLDALRRKWAEAQGVYHILDAFPAGLLCIIRLEGDEVKGEVILNKDSGQGGTHSDRVEFFTVRLMEPTYEGSDAHEAFDCVGLRVDEVSVTASEHPPDVCMELPEAKELFTDLHIFHGLADPRCYSQFLTLRLGLDFDVYDVNSLWDMYGPSRRSGGLTRELMPVLVRALVCVIPDRSLTLGRIRSPSPSRLHDPNILHIRPGFYVGDFGGADYGNFSHEACLVDYTHIDLDSPPYSEDHSRFQRIFRRDVPYPFSCLQQCLRGSCHVGLATCTKATGDVHVPVGQVAWVALVEPHYQALGIPELPPQPGGLLDKDGRKVDVVKCWPGAGTLAGAGFREARWDFGWLLLLAEGRDTQLAFAWQGDLEVIVLSWARLQDDVRYSEVEPQDWSRAF